MPEHDPFQEGDADFDALRDAWRSLQAPEATPDADRADAVTRASVDWMREAWSAIEPPVVALPASLVWRARLRTARRNAPILAAAAALVVLALSIWDTSPPTPPESERLAVVPGDVEPAGGAPETALDPDRGPAAGSGGGDAAAPDEPQGARDLAQGSGAPDAPAPTVVSAAPEENAIVLEHGSVRLVLLDAAEVTTTIDHELELNPGARLMTPASPALPVSPTLPEEGTR